MKKENLNKESVKRKESGNKSFGNEGSLRTPSEKKEKWDKPSISCKKLTFMC